MPVPTPRPIATHPVHALFVLLRKGLVWLLLVLVPVAVGNVVFDLGAFLPRKSILHFLGDHLLLTALAALVVLVIILEWPFHWWLHRNDLDPALRDKALIVPANKLNYGITTDGPIHLRLPVWPPKAELITPADQYARDAIATSRAVVIRGAPTAGKTHLAGKLLGECGDQLVIMPYQTGTNSPDRLDSLHGQDVVLFLDDIHEHIETFNPLAWWQALQQACGADHVTLIATVRGGDYWNRVQKEQPSFVRAIGEHRIVDITMLSETDAQTQGKQLGLTPQQVQERSEGTLGSLIVDRSEMAREYERLHEPPLYNGVPASRILNAAKLLHTARQPRLQEDLLKTVAEEALGTQRIDDDQWHLLKKRLEDQRFGRFHHGFFETYAPYLEGDAIVTYHPSPDTFLRLEPIFQHLGDPEAMFYYGVAVDFDLHDRPLAKDVWTQAMTFGAAPAAFNLGLLLTEDGDRDGAKAAYQQGMDLGHGSAAINLGNLLREDGDREGARTAYQRGMDLGHGAAAFNLGNLLREDEDRSGAKAAYQQSLALGEGNAAVFLGMLLEEDDDREGAKTAYQRGLDLGEGRAAIFLGMLLEKENRDSAKAAYQRGAELGDGHAAALHGMILEQEENRDGAKTAYQQGLTLGYGGAAVNLGLLLEEEDRDGAKATYQHGMELGNGKAAINLGILLEEDKDRAGARVAYQQSLTLSRQTQDRIFEAHALNAIGLLDYDAGEFTSAHQRFTEAAQINREMTDTDEAIPLSNLGLALLGLGREAVATQAYCAALVMFYQAANSVGITWCIQGLSAAALARDNAHLAAQLGGAAERMSQTETNPLSHSQQRRADALLTPVHALRNDPAIDAAWLAGHSLTDDEAIAIALGDIAP